MTAASRTPSAIDRLAEGWVDTLAALRPTLGTYIGRHDVDGELADLSPEGIERYTASVRETLHDLESLAPADPVDEVTRADLLSELHLDLELHEAGWPFRDLNVLESPAQDIRSAFDLMPTATADDWSVVAARLGAIPQALRGYRATLQEGVDRGIVPARRQVLEVAKQIVRYSADDGFFASFVAQAAPAEGQLPASLARELSDRASAARIAYDELRSFLIGTLADRASERDAVGRDLYGLLSRRFLGTTIDLDETYEWGREELARMVAEQTAIAGQILPGATVDEAVAHLEKDPARKLHGTAELQRWMQETSDRAVRELSGTHFDIPEELRRLECLIAPTQEGGIYYTGPTDDFSRPGRMWWSVPEGVTEFDTWRELTTVYHEGVPGHHLQIGQAVYNRAQLNSWRRLIGGTSGMIEGWALYAERLMESLGYLDDPADKLGMLDGQRMRAARVVLDIGVHLEKPKLDGTGTWDADTALDFLRANVNMSEEFVRFEVNRYLGWPGQAPSYKVGQRIWEQVRDGYARQRGTDFSLRDFHKHALALGGVGLDTLRAALLES